MSADDVTVAGQAGGNQKSLVDFNVPGSPSVQKFRHNLSLLFPKTTRIQGDAEGLSQTWSATQGSGIWLIPFDSDMRRSCQIAVMAT